MKKSVIRLPVFSPIRLAALAVLCFASAPAMVAGQGARTADGQEIVVPEGHCVQNCGNGSTTPSGPSPEELRQRKMLQRMKAKAWSTEEAMDYVERGDWDNAIRSFEEALDKDPDDEDLEELLKSAKAEKAGQSSRPANGLKTFIIRSVEVTGSAYVITADGRRFNGQGIALVPINARAQVFVGPNSRLVMRLEDETTFTIGPDSNMILDDFVYAPNTSVSKFTARLTIGVFRWVTGTIVGDHRQKAILETPGPTVGGIRGTDFEIRIEPDGSGYIKMHEGLIDYTERGSSVAKSLRTGQTLRFRNSVVTRIE